MKRIVPVSQTTISAAEAFDKWHEGKSVISSEYEGSIAFLTKSPTCTTPPGETVYWFSDLRGGVHSRTTGRDNFLRRLSANESDYAFWESQEEFLNYVRENNLTFDA